MRADTAPSVWNPGRRSWASASGISPASHSKRTTLRSPSSSVRTWQTRLPSLPATATAVSTTPSSRSASIQSSSEAISAAVW